MNKSFKTTTNQVDESVVALVRKETALKIKYGLSLGVFTQNQTTFPPYDETNTTYKEYEEAETKANTLINNNQELPIELQEYLLQTKKQRQNWHEYCKTHSRKSEPFTEIPNLFD